MRHVEQKVKRDTAIGRNIRRCRLEAGLRHVTAGTLRALCRILHTPLDDLLRPED